MKKIIKSERTYEDEFIEMVEDNNYDVNDQFTYMAGITPEHWTNEDTETAKQFDVDVAGYYILGDYEGMILAGRLQDIYDFCDQYLGMGLHPDYVCPLDSFDWEDGEWVTGGPEVITNTPYYQQKRERDRAEIDRIMKDWKVNSSRKPIKSGRYQVVTYKTYGGDDGYKERVEFDDYNDAEYYANDIRYSHKGVGIFDLQDKLLMETMGTFPWTPEGGYTYSPKMIKKMEDSARWFYGDEQADEKIKEWKMKNGIQSSRRPVKSGRYIKSGTSNFVSNDGPFPIVVYISEIYRIDEETGEETDEIDYDAEQWDYDDAYDFAKDLADEMDITLCQGSYRRGLEGGDDYSSPYNIGIVSGYYEGIQIQIEDNGSFDPEYLTRENYEYEHDDYFDELPQEEQDRMISETETKLIEEQESKINEYLNKLCSDYGWIKLGVSARFSNGETWYSKIDNSRKPVKSSIEDACNDISDKVEYYCGLNDSGTKLNAEQLKDLKEAVRTLNVCGAYPQIWMWGMRTLEKYGMNLDSSRKPVKSACGKKKGKKKTIKSAADRLDMMCMIEEVCDKLRDSVPNSKIDYNMNKDKNSGWIEVVQENKAMGPGYDTMWTFWIDFDKNTVEMLDPQELDLGTFKNDYDIFTNIKNGLNGGGKRPR